MWLLEPETLALMRDLTKAGFTPTADQQQEIVAALGRNEDGTPRILTKAGATARIEITGVLTQTPNIMALIFGGGNTVYSDITQAIADVEADKSVDAVDFFFDTPGGSTAGLFDAMTAIEAMTKPTRAIVGNMAASAGFILASQADKIVASNRASSIGSFGVAASIAVSDMVVDITNTESPDKRPDVTTEEGKAKVREYLDALHSLIVEYVAKGRGVPEAKALADFGRGGLLLADEAQSRGMIDSVDGSAPALTVVTSQKSETASTGDNDQPEARKMDLDELKAKHPELYRAAVKVGADAERDRVTAFVTAGEMSGDMKTALEQIKGGGEMTQTLSMQFMMAATNRGDMSARDQETAEAAAAAAAAAAADPANAPQGKTDADKAAEQVANTVCEQLGYFPNDNRAEA